MEAPRVTGSDGSEKELELAIRTLAATIREAGECMLDLEQALIKLRMARDPRMMSSVGSESNDCLKRAMRR
ncbi:hypothetical protein [Piscinibacter terrae]|uniref:Uncharacterized protein n=1 Tax=Piscinibacter terrae TaxID=2496871 RepID=A0A3N7HVC6_9BURK|nr:hypothetical protein [Albitalea terrae]RQP25306.1 hypothetical protein DZC73_10785 [Albitalea terrae]